MRPIVVFGSLNADLVVLIKFLDMGTRAAVMLR